MAALYATCSLARIGAVTVRRGDLEARWSQLAHLTDARLVEDPRAMPRLVAYGDLDVEVDPCDGEVIVTSDGRVHPAHTGRGIGRFLVEQAIDRARREARAHRRPSALLTATVVDGDDEARGFFARREFQPVRHLLTLRLDLHAAPPAPAWPSGVRCRALVPGEDEERVWQAHQRAFAAVTTHLPIRLEDYVADRFGRGDLDPQLVLLAEVDEVEEATKVDEVDEVDGSTDVRRPVGQSRAIVGLAVCRAGSPGAAHDGLVRDLAVVPGWRRRGVGMALLRTAFAAFRARGLTGAALDVDDVDLEGAVGLYRRAGMRVVRRTDVLERRIGSDAPARR